MGWGQSCRPRQGACAKRVAAAWRAAPGGATHKTGQGLWVRWRAPTSSVAPNVASTYMRDDDLYMLGNMASGTEISSPIRGPRLARVTRAGGCGKGSWTGQQRRPKAQPGNGQIVAQKRCPLPAAADGGDTRLSTCPHGVHQPKKKGVAATAKRRSDCSPAKQRAPPPKKKKIRGAWAQSSPINAPGHSERGSAPPPQPARQASVLGSAGSPPACTRASAPPT